jgi:hypothetical protein
MFRECFKMMTCLVLLPLLIWGTAVKAGETSPQVGATGDEVLRLYHPAGVRLATERPANQSQTPSPLIRPQIPLDEEKTFSLDEWVLLQSISKSVSIPWGQHYAFRLDLANRNMVEISPANSLSVLCLEAINRAPHWLRNDLTDNLLQFGDMQSLTDAIAQLILNAQDPYVDEICFTMAHLSPSLLMNDQMDLDRDLAIVTENVEGVYAADECLSYVHIRDYGTSADDNYWSTAEYAIRTAEGDTIQIEVEPDIYYWFVVHPRISDEVPLYIDPSTGESAAPPVGKFWRDFFLYEPDSGYCSLQDMLDTCGIMYGNLFNNSTDDNGAVGIVTRWIQDVMDFGSGVERPIQPVRIYHLHLGRCGEHQDITAAAARAALIPAVGTTAICNDHVWNEFWDGAGWKTWEPVNNYVGDSLAYQGWGKRFPAVFDWRGDGFIWTVTQRYHSHTTTLTVHIKQANDSPVDGAKVKVLSEYEYGGLQLATCGYTNSDGTVSFTIGGERNIYLNISSPLGRYPSDPDDGVLVIENSDTTVEYEWTYNYGSSMATITPDEAEPPQDSLNHFHLNIEYTTRKEATYGQIFRYSDFVAEVGESRSDFFICDEQNYNRYAAGMNFEAFSIAHLMDSGEIDFTLPDDRTWYAVLSNVNSLSNYQRMDLTASLYIDDALAAGVADEGMPREYALFPNYPNPFNPETRIQFALPQNVHVELSVFNALGQRVATLIDGTLPAGEHQVSWDGKDAFNAPVATGLYIYRLKAGTFVDAKKMLLLR